MIEKDWIVLTSPKSVSLSALFSEACKRLDIATEQSMGCERIGTQLILHMAPDETITFELVEDEESGGLILGEQVTT